MNHKRNSNVLPKTIDHKKIRTKQQRVKRTLFYPDLMKNTRILSVSYTGKQVGEKFFIKYHNTSRSLIT